MPVSILAVKKFGALRPADEQSVEALRRIADGDVVRLEMTKPTRRSLRMHRLFFALLGVAGDAVGWNTEQTLTWVKIAVGHTDTIISPRTGEVAYVPRSIAFMRMDQIEFQTFFDRATTAILDRLLPEGTVRAEFEQEVYGRIDEIPEAA